MGSEESDMTDADGMTYCDNDETSCYSKQQMKKHRSAVQVSIPKQTSRRRPQSARSLRSFSNQKQQSTFNINVHQQPTLYQQQQNNAYFVNANGPQSPEIGPSITPLVGFNGVQINKQQQQQPHVMKRAFTVAPCYSPHQNEMVPVFSDRRSNSVDNGMDYMIHKQQQQQQQQSQVMNHRNGMHAPMMMSRGQMLRANKL